MKQYNVAQVIARRHFLRFVGASPLAMLRAQTVTNPKDALDIMDFEAAAQKAIPPSHWGYLMTGVDDDATYRANIEGYKHIQLRPRRLIDTGRADLSTEVLGMKWDSPIFICPLGSQKAFNPEGEVATARAAKAKKTEQILSMVTTCSVEDVAAALGHAPWSQMYAPPRWENVEKLVRRMEAAGSPVLVLTVDLTTGRNVETQERFRRLDTRNCVSCHPPGGNYARKPMFQPLDMTGVTDAANFPAMNWNFVDRLKKSTKMKLTLKGIETREDAKLAVEHGVDAVIVSNHGGRATETGRGTIEILPEVIDAVGGRIPVLVDGGVRRGSDVFKALAMGARAVGIGRPYAWGLGAFGQPGVERVLEILQRELSLVMRQCGAGSISDIRRSSIIT